MNFEVNYQELYQDYDFDQEDRPCVYPEESYSKYLFSNNQNFSNIYSNESSCGGQAYKEDWKDVCCTNYLGQCENKHNYALLQLKWMKDGKQVVTSSKKGKIIKWDAQNLCSQNPVSVHDDAIYAMDWTNNQEFLISGDKTGEIIYSTDLMAQLNRFKPHPDACIRDISCSMSSVKFATCSDDRKMIVIDFPTSKKERIFEEHNSDVLCVDWHPFHSLIVTGSKDHKILV